MGGIGGRLFREFAVTVTLTILVSVIVSLTLTPMLCSRFIKHHDRASHGRSYLAFERGFDLLLGGYKRGLHLVLRHPFITLCSRSEEHTSELQSLMRISYAVFCLKKKTNTQSTLL